MLDMRLLSLPLLLLFGAPCHGDAPRFGNQFQDHMVLQRDAPLSLWGFDAGVDETLRVCLGARCVHTQCAGDGTWRVGTIEPQRASVTPRDLWVIRERDGQVELGDLGQRGGVGGVGDVEELATGSILLSLALL